MSWQCCVGRGPWALWWYQWKRRRGTLEKRARRHASASHVCITGAGRQAGRRQVLGAQRNQCVAEGVQSRPINSSHRSHCLGVLLSVLCLPQTVPADGAQFQCVTYWTVDRVARSRRRTEPSASSCCYFVRGREEGTLNWAESPFLSLHWGTRMEAGLSTRSSSYKEMRPWCWLASHSQSVSHSLSNGPQTHSHSHSLINKNKSFIPYFTVDFLFSLESECVASFRLDLTTTTIRNGKFLVDLSEIQIQLRANRCDAIDWCCARQKGKEERLLWGGTCSSPLHSFICVIEWRFVADGISEMQSSPLPTKWRGKECHARAPIWSLPNTHTQREKREERASVSVTARHSTSNPRYSNNNFSYFPPLRPE